MDLSSDFFPHSSESNYFSCSVVMLMGSNSSQIPYNIMLVAG